MPSYAATAGSGPCSSSYTSGGTGSASVRVAEDAGYCYVSFHNRGNPDTATTYSWTVPSNVTSASVLVVGGGGGGGSRHAGGGGGGEYVQVDSYTLTPGDAVSIQTGGGGSGAAGGNSYQGAQGQTSSFKVGANGLTALGGGAGNYGVGGNGGSGAGGSGTASGGSAVSSSQQTLAGSTLSGVTFANPGAQGANESSSTADFWAGGGGGGAGSAGALPTQNGTLTNALTSAGTAVGGAGGGGKTPAWLPASVQSTLAVGETSASSIYFAAGGGGGMGADGSAGGPGGVGGGGDGVKYAIPTSSNDGLMSSGSGGGGSGFDDISPATLTGGISGNAPAGDGGSGIVIVKYSATPISAPQNVTVTARVNSLDIAWSAPADLNGQTISAYQVEYSTNGTSSWTPASSSISASATSYTISDLTPGTSYYVRVVAKTSSWQGVYGYPWTKVFETTNLARTGSATGNYTYATGYGLSDNSLTLTRSDFSRVRYRIQGRYTANDPIYYADVDFDTTISSPYTGGDSYNNLYKLQVPVTTAGNGQFEIAGDVSDMNVYSNAPNVTVGKGLTGRLEIWPWNYSAPVSAGASAGGSASVYDYADTPAFNSDYGSFQIHNLGDPTPHTIVAWNRQREFDNLADVDLGFGNNGNGNPDWTFAGVNNVYTAARTDFKFQSFANLPTAPLQGRTVTFDKNDGSATTTTQVVSDSSATNLTSNSFTRSGYEFLGWNTLANASGTKYSDGQSVTLTADQTLYAIWASTTPLISLNSTDLNSFNPSSGSISDLGSLGLSATSLTNTSTPKTLGLTADTERAWTFAGEASSAGDYIDLGDITTTNLSRKGLTVDFEANFGTSNLWERILDFSVGGSSQDNVWVGRNGTSNNISIEVFHGSTSQGYCSTTSNPLATPSLSRWTISIDGVNCRIYQNGSLLRTAAYSALPTDTTWRQNYVGRSNWSGDSSFGGQLRYLRIYEGALTPSQIGDVSFKTVSFDANTGALNTSPVSLITSGTISLPTAGPTKSTYDFSGWSTTTSGTDIGATYAPTVDVTLYAVWTPSTYNVTFNSNGGSSVTASTFQTGGSVSAPTAPTRAGYTFAGWSATDGGSTITFPYSPGVTNDITLYAKWTSLGYELKFDNNGGDGTTSSEYAYTGEPINLPSAPTRTGYTFNGWATAASGGTVVGQAGDSYSPLSPTNLVLRYELDNTNSYSGSGTSVIDIASRVNSSVSGSISGTTAGSPSFGASPGYLDFTTAGSQYLLTGNLGVTGRLGTSTDNGTTNNNVSMFVWVYPQNNNGVIVSELGQATINTSWHDSQIEMVNGKLAFNVWAGGYTSTTITTTNTIGLNKWYYVGFTYNGTTLTAYVYDDQGNAVALSNNNRPVTKNRNSSIYYGLAATDSTNLGSGAYGDFRLGSFQVYKTGLSSTTVLQNFKNTCNRFLGVTANCPVPTLYATWTASTFNVFYDEKGGSTVPDGTFDTGGTVTFPTNPTKDGYTFGGWSASNVGLAVSTPYAPGVSGDITLYAIWVSDAPSSPSGLQLTSGDTSVDLSWTAASSNGDPVTDYKIEYQLRGAGTWSEFSDGVSTSTSATVTGLTTGKVYNFRVSAINSGGTSDPSAVQATITFGGLVSFLDASDSNSYSGTGSDWLDLTGLGNSVSKAGAPTFNSSGKYFDLSGSGQYFTYGTTDSDKGKLYFSDGSPYTISILFSPDNASTTSKQQLYSRWNGTVGGSYFLAIQNSGAILQRERSPWSSSAFGAIASNNKYLATYVFEGAANSSSSGNAIMYLNGVEVGRVSYSGYIPTKPTIETVIGAAFSNNVADSFFDGKIYGAQVFDQALRASDVSTLATLLDTAPGAPTIDSVTPSSTELSVAFTAGANDGTSILKYQYSTDGGSTWRDRSSGSTSSPLVITTTSSSNQALVSGTSYNVKIRAVNTLDGVASNAVSSSLLSNYTITYNYNGADGGTRPVDSTPTIGSSFTLPNPTKTTMLFGGWYSDSGLTTFVGYAGDSYTPSANGDLYARWTNLYLNLDGNNDSSLVNSSSTWTSILPGSSNLSGAATGATYFSSGGIEGFSFSNGQGAVKFGAGLVDVPGDMTVEAWVQPSSLPTGWNIIASKWFTVNKVISGSKEWQFAIRNEAGNNARLNLSTSTDGTNNAANDAYGSFVFPTTSSDWYHIGFTLTSAGSLQFFVNGQVDGAAKTGALRAVNATAELWLGDARTDRNNAFRGKMSQFRIYNKALSASEILSSYSSSYDLFGQNLITYKAGPDGTGSDVVFTKFDAATHTIPDSTTSNGYFTNTGQIISGWNTQADGSGTTYGFGDSYTSASDLVLYPVWGSSIVSVQWDTNGGTSVSNSSFTIGQTLSKPTDPTKTDYIFGGWSTSETSNQGDIANRITSWPYSSSETSGFTLYAIWLSVAPPTNVTAVGNPGGVAVSWSAPSTSGSEPPTAYQVEYSTTGTGSWTTASSSISSSATSYSITGLTNGTKYYVRVAAVYSGQLGAYGYPWTKLYEVTGERRTTAGAVVYATGYGLTGGAATENSSATFSRVRYRMQANYGGQLNYADVDFDKTLSPKTTASETFDSVSMLQVPTHVSSKGGVFEIQGNVSDMTIQSNVSGVDQAIGVTGRLEIWPWNYGVARNSPFTDGSASSYDYNDTPSLNSGDHSSFQVHNINSLQTVMVWNLQRASATDSEIGFGPNTSGAGQPDWTYSTQAESDFNLQIFANIPVTPSGTITITFNANDGSGTPATSTQSATSGSAATLTANSFTRAGYSFAGWNTDPDGTSGTDYTDGDSVTFSVSTPLYAKWTADTYTVTYNYQSATSGNTTSTDTYTTGSGSPIVLPTPAKTGYNFSGWYDSSFVTKFGDGGANFEPTATQTIYAKWTPATYTVTYNYNSATSGNTAATGSYTTAGIELVLPTPLKTGYTFAGWYEASDFSSTKLGLTYTTTANITIYAKWTATTYTVLYDYVGADGSNHTESDTYTTGSTEITLPTPTKTGYTFAGWYESSTYSGSAKTSPYTTTLNRTLYAKWTAIDYTVTYDTTNATGGTEPTDSANYNIGQSVTIKINSGGLYRTGYTLSGWVLDPTDVNESTKAAGSRFAMPASDVTLYPVWTANTYTLTFNSNGATSGVPVAATDTYTTGTGSKSLPGAGTLAKTGYSFVGWNLNSTDTTALSSITTTQNLTLYAIWELVPYSFTYDLNGGSGSAPTTQSANITEQVSVAGIGAATKSGHWFAGWNTVADGSGSDYAAGVTVSIPIGGKTLYAVWVPDQYRISYNANGGTGGPDLSATGGFDEATFGSSYNIRPKGNLARTGYSFSHWTTNSAGTGTKYDQAQNALDEEVSFIPTQNTTFYAQWTAINYSHTFDVAGGNAALGTHSRTIGQQLTMPSAGTKSGYTFDSWSDGTNEYPVGSTYTVIAATVTFTAQWTPNVYTVVYDWQGGSTSGATTTSANYTVGTGAMELPGEGSYSKDGYTFAGWSTTADGTVALTSWYPLADDTLYAIWEDGEYTLSYNPKGGNAGTALGTVNRGSSITLPTPVRSGFVFQGWYDQETNGNKLGNGGDSYTPGNSKTMFARWVQKSLSGVDLAKLDTAATLSVGSGRSGGSLTRNHAATNTSASVVVPNGALPENTTVTARYFKDTERQAELIPGENNYIFSLLVSWITGSGDTATVPDTEPGTAISVTLTSDAIKAGQRIYQVVGDEVTDLGTATQDGTITVQLTQDPEIIVAATAPEAPTGVSATAGDTKATVSWTASNNGGSEIVSYTVVASPGGASCTTASTSCEIAGLTNGTAYTFKVLATNAVGSSAYSSASTAITPAPASFTVTYNSNGGSSVANGNFVSGGSIASAPTAPTRSGYTFSGWSTTLNDEDTVVTFPYSPGVTQNITLYALWTAAQSDGGSSSGSSTAPITPSEIGYKPTPPATPVAETGPVGSISGSSEKVAIIESSDGRSLVAQASGFKISMEAKKPDGSAVPVADNQTLEFDFGTKANISGTGLKPNTLVEAWIFSEPTYLGKIQVASDGSFSQSLVLPATLKAGEHTLQLGTLSSAGRLVTLSVPITIDGKVNAGSFKGYVFLYAKGYQGRKFSAKVGKDWVISNSLQSRYVRLVERTGKGYHIKVRVYIDGVYQTTIPLKTK